MTTRREIPLHEIATGIFDGPHATPPEATDGPLFLRIDNITPEGRLDLSEQRYISPQDFPRWTRRVTPEPGDVVFSYEATLHRYVVIPEGFYGCLGRRLALVRPDRKFVEPQYLHYYFLTDQWRRTTATAIINGATVDRISLTRIRDLMLDLPSLKVQRNVIHILSGYDDLIENNRRRMALLEESARQRYREWFVRLRFPGHEHTRIVEGVPEGWERVPLGSCVTFLSGGTPKKSEPAYWDGDIPWISSGEMTQLRLQDSSLRLTEEGVIQGSRLVPANTILIVVRGMSLAKEFRLAVTSKPVTFNQDLKALQCHPDVSPEYLFASLVAQRDQIRDRATEASHGTKKLDTPVLTGVPILLAPEVLQREFRDFMLPINSQWDNCWNQNQKLRTARDLLLPRLMSGEIAV